MRILLTNDDGVDSEGLVELEAGLRRDHDVWVVAPEHNRSGCAHAVSLSNPTRVRAIGDRRYACSGSPADCVLISRLGIVPSPIHVVLAGINHGPNLGTDTIYSGTAAAARQAALDGIPAVALSLYGYREPYDFAPCVEFVSERLGDLMKAWVPETFVNVNFPRRPAFDGVRSTVPCRRNYRDGMHVHENARGDRFCFLDGEIPTAADDAQSDYQAVVDGHISVSLIAVHPTSIPIGDGFFV